jgi:hypothetical protein
MVCTLMKYAGACTDARVLAAHAERAMQNILRGQRKTAGSKERCLVWAEVTSQLANEQRQA